MDAVHALQSFWSGFGIPAYNENTVPTNATLPRITYEVQEGYFGQTFSLSASIWYRSHSWEEINAKLNEIANAITRGGRFILIDDGALLIRRDPNWATPMTDPDDTAIIRYRLAYELEYLR